MRIQESAHAQQAMWAECVNIKFFLEVTVQIMNSGVDSQVNYNWV